MRKPIFLAHYNLSEVATRTKLLIVADCRVNRDFINILSERLNTNADLLYLDTSRKTGKSTLARHFSYFILAIHALSIGDKYNTILFWQQFIGLYWGYLSRIKGEIHRNVFLTPLIYKSRKGMTGKIYKLFFNLSLSNPAIKGAICYSSTELKYYRRIFAKNRDKVFFILYGQSSKTRDKNVAISVEKPYLFSGGTSNRDYRTLLSAAKKIKYIFIIACTQRDIKGLKIPDNVRVFHNAYGEKFDSLMRSSYAVVLPLKDANISSGQIVLLKAMEMGKPIVTTRSAGTIDYVGETCAFLVEPQNIENLQRVLNFVVENPEEAKDRALRAKKKYQESFTIQRFAFSIAEVITQNMR